MTTGASGGLAHIGFVFPHPENGGYTDIGWLGGPKGGREPIVGFWSDGGRWAGQWSYGDGYGRDHCALESYCEAQEGLVIVIIVCRQRLDLHLALLLDLSCSPGCSLHPLLPPTVLP